MSDKKSKFPRGLRVLITIAVLAVSIWLVKMYTSYDAIYYYYSIGAAALIALAVIYLTYHKRSPNKSRVRRIDDFNTKSEEETAGTEIESESMKPGDISSMPDIPKSASTHPSHAAKDVESSEISPIPLIDDPSTLTLDEKNSLVNAVWYRCENPYCKYTSFLSVHHIVGSTNKLDNLIVLCPYCHDLAHRGEIPETEMRSWIEDRAERWKFKPEWKYF